MAAMAMPIGLVWCDVDFDLTVVGARIVFTIVTRFFITQNYYVEMECSTAINGSIQNNKYIFCCLVWFVVVAVYTGTGVGGIFLTTVRCTFSRRGKSQKHYLIFTNLSVVAVDVVWRSFCVENNCTQRRTGVLGKYR